MSVGLYRHILCPTDFSPAAEAPVAEARRLADDAGARLTYLHVIQETALEDDDGDEEMSAFYEELEEKARQRMDALAPEADGDRVRCNILRGQPLQEILRTAVREEADLIVIGSHGLSGVEESPFGSTGQAVVLLSPIPVLVVKPEGYVPTGVRHQSSS